MRQQRLLTKIDPHLTRLTKTQKAIVKMLVQPCPVPFALLAIAAEPDPVVHCDGPQPNCL
jgi:hypothetical protein